MNSKREQFVEDAARPSRTPIVAVSIAALLLGVVALAVVARGRGVESLSAARAGADVAIPLGDVADGVARFYRYTTAAGREVRFFVMRSSDGVVRAAFDSCDVCYREKKGYRQEGNAMVCVNCGQRFQSTDINEVRGGCNPAPLEREVREGQVLLSGAALSAGAWYF
jgi:uncharacterized membrane protein